MTTKRTLFFLKTLKFLQRDKDKTQLQPEQSLRAAKRKNKAAVLMVVSISLCVCVTFHILQQRLAWLDSASFWRNTELVLFTAHWLQ